MIGRKSYRHKTKKISVEKYISNEKKGLTKYQTNYDWSIFCLVCLKNKIAEMIQSLDCQMGKNI